MFLPDNEELPATGIDRHRIDDELTQHVPEDRSEWAQYEFAEDGMPKPTVPTAMPFAPPLHPDTLCCIADTRKFCLRGRWGAVLVEIEPELVERAPNGKYRIQFSQLVKVVLDAGLPKFWMEGNWLSKHRDEAANVATYLRDNASRSYDFEDGWYEVEPIRPQCKHFARQASDFQDLTDHMFVSRLCTARRDSGGEFLGLRDTQMHACDMRDPFDLKGIERLDKFDQNKIILGSERTIEDGGGFDVDDALEKAIDNAHGGTIGNPDNVFRKG